MVALIREAQVFRPALRAAFVINRRVSTTVIGREARQALADQRVRDALGTGPVRAGGQQQQDGIDGRHGRRV
ncbi:hypothetical protein G6F68_021651 [Rhizopus microsporus]|nr:hypothetical protein G6F68_021651 [Rhizopus microsporus]